MATKGDSEGFVSSPLDGPGACHKDSYFPVIDENTAELRDTDAEFKRLKADFLRIARSRVNPQEALRQFDVGPNGDQQISQS